MIKSTLKSCKLLTLTLIFLSIVSCVTTSASFDKTTEGHLLEQPINTEVMKQSILTSLISYNWEVTKTEDGFIKARFSKSENTIVAVIKIEYNEEAYEISYLGSKNLDENLEKMTIHRNYNRWIANLNKSIYIEYIKNL